MEIILKKIKKFRDERGWGKHHTPRNFATAIVVEAGELMEKFQWKLDEKYSQEEIEEIKYELTDIFIYMLQLADLLDIDLKKATDEKIKLNARKYPKGEIDWKKIKKYKYLAKE